MEIKQYDCFEGESVDLTQAEAVLREKPDVIILEAPADSEKDPSTIFNNYEVYEKPIEMVLEYQKNLRESSSKFKWVESDIFLYENIVKLWKEGHNVDIYRVDAPAELLKLSTDSTWPGYRMTEPLRKGVEFKWWVYVYIRETIMTKNIRFILEVPRYSDRKILIFLQKFHWDNVRFRLENNEDDIFSYYFSDFKDVNKININDKVQELENDILYKYWNKVKGLS